jgi:hypothetical protein
MFGLAMGVATVFVISSRVEPLVWVAIFLVCAYLVAKHAPGWHFLHGLMIGIFNGVWITAAHILLFDQYVANHAREAQMMRDLPISPRLMMAITGPVIGVVSGAILGLLALVASRLVGRATGRTVPD